MSVCAYHDSAPDQNPKQDVSCVGASLKITLKISGILQAELLHAVVVMHASSHVQTRPMLVLACEEWTALRCTLWT